MELRQIWTLLLRRWWLVLIPPLVVGAISLRNWRALVTPPVTYSTALRFTVGQPPVEPATGFDARYYDWLTSEYVANGLEEWVRGRGYAEAVSAELAARHNLAIAPERLQGALAADSDRSLLVLYLNWPDPAELRTIAEAAVRVLRDDNAQAFPMLGPVGATPAGAVVTPLDAVNVNANAPALRDQLDLPLRAGLALVGGLALAFLVDYLDPSLRTRAEVEALGLGVLGEIPRRRRWPGRRAQSG
jgi:capsular polysaccharide biosynthesis protein